jgi:hypothetical protein
MSASLALSEGHGTRQPPQTTKASGTHAREI